MENQTVNSIQPIKDVISLIKQHASDSEVFRTMCRSFVNRERTKETLTVRGLAARLEKEGYPVRKEYLENELHFLATLGLGSLRKNNVGHIAALTGLKVTLQSIGQAAGSQITNLKPWKKQKRFKKLVPSVPKQEVKEPVVTKKISIPKKKYTANLIVNIDGNPVNVSSFELAPEELGEFMIEFSHMTKNVRKQV